jgi:2-polyprenyl-6-methoxyphenol hydroxylase-like FAD-dependent oxidoreductase
VISGYNVGIIGGGFVGSAVAFGFGSSNSYDFNIKIYDIDPNKSSHSFEETVGDSDFICLECRYIISLSSNPISFGYVN